MLAFILRRIAQAVLVMLAVGLFFVVINLVVDLLYHAVDPRLRVQPI